MKRGLMVISTRSAAATYTRYVGEFESRWNHRKDEDGPQVSAAIRERKASGCCTDNQPS